LWISALYGVIADTMPDAPKTGHKDVRTNRPLGDEEFKAKLEMTKAFCDTAKSYMQMSAAGLALPLFFVQVVLGKSKSEAGFSTVPRSLAATWVLFLFCIGCGLIYQWLAIRRIWDQYHGGHRTVDNMHEPGYRQTKWLMQTATLNMSWFWLGMTGSFFAGAVCFVIYASSLLLR
jgi:hypothetical protein